jgi:hypothetical protein
MEEEAEMTYAEEEEEERPTPRRRKRSKKYSGKGLPERRPAPKRPRSRKAEDEELLDISDLDLDELDLEELDIELEGEEEGEVCPPGCVPAEEEAEEEALEDEEAEEEGAEEGEEEELATEASTEKPAEEPNVVVQRVYTDDELESLAAARFDFVLFNENSEDPHYAVFAEGSPLCEIHRADLTFDPGAYELFTRDSYKDRLRESIASFGVVKTLNTVKARFYATAAYEGNIAEEMKKEIQAGMDGERREALADLKDSLLNVVGVVSEGSIKNYWGENPLKEALVKQLGNVGVQPNAAIDVIEAAWKVAAAPYFEFIVNKADELLGAPAEVLGHHTTEISAMEWRHPGHEPESDFIPTAPTQASVPTSVPIATPHRTVEAATEQTQAPEPPASGGQWDRNYWRQRLGMSKKLTAASTNAFAALSNKFKK